MVVAHRGASAEQPENTIAAFEAAIDAGADAVEFDVRMTADGHAVVMHDPDVSRTTDGSGIVSEMMLDEVVKLGIPTLEETLKLLSGRAAVDIEIKNSPDEPGYTPDAEPAVEATLIALDEVAFSSLVIVSSFNPRSIAHSRALRPEIPTGLLTWLDVDADDALAQATGQGHPWVLPFVTKVLEAGDGFGDRVHDAGALLGVWIADDPETARALFELGADAVATNDPRAVVAVLPPLRYFRGQGETMSHESTDMFFEVVGDTIVRQVTRYEDRWLCSLDDWFEPVGMLLTDQPIQPGEFSNEDEITRAEFQRVWALALEDRRHGPGS
jgi:glycerophosphoryl diester phosphodiesterase